VVAISCDQSLSRDARPIPTTVRFSQRLRPFEVLLAREGIGSSRDGDREELELHQFPWFFIEAQGSRSASDAPFCSSSIEMPSGERMNAMCPSRGGRLMVTP